MSKSKLQTILGFVNIGLAIAHSTGVTLGHFGGEDFIQLAEEVNGLLLSSITPAVAAAPAAVAASAVAAAPAASVVATASAAPVTATLAVVG